MSVAKRTLAAMLVFAATMVSTVGCKGVDPPNWGHPGPAEYQQARANEFDPYPQVTGPDMTGVRPEGYDRPPAEVLRVQPEANSGSSGGSTWRWPWQ